MAVTVQAAETINKVGYGQNNVNNNGDGGGKGIAFDMVVPLDIRIFLRMAMLAILSCRNSKTKRKEAAAPTSIRGNDRTMMAIKNMEMRGGHVRGKIFG